MALRSVYDDYSSTFETLLEKDSTFSIYYRNILCLLLEIFKVVHGETEKEIF